MNWFGLPSHVGLAYKTALQLCTIRELHEGKIAKGKRGDAELLQLYLVFPVLPGVYARDVRNWVEPLSRRYLLALERFRDPETKLCAVFEQSLHGGFQTAQIASGLGFNSV
ncbi:unnamed protein product [Calypogeia fissa]